MAKQPKWGERVEFSLDRRPKPSAAVKYKGLEIMRLNSEGGYDSYAIGKDFRVGETYTLEKRTFWWLLV